MLKYFLSKAELKKENERLKEQIAHQRAENIILSSMIIKFGDDCKRLSSLLATETISKNRSNIEIH